MGCYPSKVVSTIGTRRFRAALLIQSWYRRYRARLEIRRRCTWKIFQSIEYSGEQDQLKLHNFFNSILINMKTDGDGPAPLTKAFNVNKRSSIYDTQMFGGKREDTFDSNLDDMIIEATYQGPHLTFPLTLNQLHKLVQSFKRQLTLHAKYTIQLLLETRKLLKTHSNVRYATTSLSNKVTVCGDIHGSLSDLFMIFYKNGLPAVNNPYIFNGDFVDRGQFSTEVALILFSCFLMNPNEVYINRGNHEDNLMNLRYGFVQELQRKYKKHSKTIIRVFKDLFSWLPLATIIDDQIMVCHGGISDTTDLKILAKIDRHMYMSTLQPPCGCDDISTISQKHLIEWKQVLDILWSDPQPVDGCQTNIFRGGGSYFGPDVTKRFLDRHKLRMLIRSHECKVDGYEYEHDGKVLTVFSSSNYYEMGSNFGAYVLLEGLYLTIRIIQFVSQHTSSRRKISFTQRINILEQAALQDLKERILTSKTELIQEFQKFDQNNSERIKSSDWCFAMETVLEMDLPWRTLKSKLVQADSDGYALYHSTFQELEVKHKYSGNGPSITEMLYKHKDNLEAIFRLIDTDHSGHISMREFHDALNILIKQLDLKIGENDIQGIAESIDINRDGVIDFNEFLEAFRIVDNYGKEKPSSRSKTRNRNDAEVLLTSEIAESFSEDFR